MFLQALPVTTKVVTHLLKVIARAEPRPQGLCRQSTGKHAAPVLAQPWKRLRHVPVAAPAMSAVKFLAPSAQAHLQCRMQLRSRGQAGVRRRHASSSVDGQNAHGRMLAGRSAGAGQSSSITRPETHLTLVSDHNLSATAAARGHVRDITFVASTYSPHTQACGTQARA